MGDILAHRRDACPICLLTYPWWESPSHLRDKGVRSSPWWAQMVCVWGAQLHSIQPILRIHWEDTLFFKKVNKVT